MRRDLPTTAILIIGGLLFLAYAHPGLMTLDSCDQLTEARAGFYTDAHPPVMAALWRVLDLVIAGPFLMLVLQGVGFLVGTYLLLSRALAPRAAAIAASLTLLYPPVLTSMAFVWKDSLMAGMLLLGAGLVTSPCRRARIASLATFALATAVKYNALVATLPLLVFLFEWHPGGHALRRYAIASATWLGVTLAATGANAVLVDQPMHFWHSSLAVADIAGVVAYEDDLTDDQLRSELAGTGLLADHDIRARMREVYATKDMMKLVVGDRRLWNLPIDGTVPAPRAQRDAIERAWKSLVFGHPAAYLHHRWRTFLDVIGVTYSPASAVPRRVMHWKVFLEKLGLSTHSHRYQNAWTRLMTKVRRNTPLFEQWIYIVLALVLLAAFGWRHRDIAALLASGLLAEASLFFLAPSPDYRYSHWTIVVTCLAVIMLVARRARVATSRSSSLPA